MSMTDPIADLLTRIRNGLRVRASSVDVRASRFVKSVAEVLKREGYVEDVRTSETVDRYRAHRPEHTPSTYVKYEPGQRSGAAAVRSRR